MGVPNQQALALTAHGRSRPLNCLSALSRNLEPQRGPLVGPDIGKSIKRLDPNPRGRRPSSAAATIGGAIKASDNQRHAD
jgi:hypothetical protein